MNLILRVLFACAVERAVIRPKPRLRVKPMTEIFRDKPKVFMAPVGTPLAPHFADWPEPWKNLDVKKLDITYRKKEYMWV